MRRAPSIPTVRRPSSRGFTLIELMISLAILSLIIVGTLTLFDQANQMAANQIARSDLQQAARISQKDLTRHGRLIGRGGLPVGNAVYPLPQGLAFGVRNNVPAATTILPSDASSPEVLEETDVLTMRGAFDVPMYYVEYRDPATMTMDTNADTGTVVLRDVTVLSTSSGLTQDLDPLGELIDAGRTVPLLMVLSSSNAIWGVARLDPATSIVEKGLDADPDDVDRITLAFEYLDGDGSDGQGTIPDPISPGSQREAFSALSSLGAYPEAEIQAARVKTLAVLQEYRYYVRDEPDGPVLSRAQVYPNTDDEYPAGGSGSLELDIADDVWDLQVAFGCDPHGAADPNDPVVDGDYPESADGSNDAWQGNNAADPGACPTGNPGHARILRFSTLIRAARPSRDHRAAEVDRIEDHDYASGDFQNQREQRLFQRHVVRTLIDLRNL